MSVGTDSTRNARAAWLGTVVAIVLLAASGVAYRLVAARLSSVHAMVSLPPGSLSVLPIKIVDWIGEDVPLDDSIIRSTDTDDHVSRIYRRQSEREAVSLFIGSGVRIRDLMPHRPEVCYTGAGWTLEVGRRIELPLANGSVLPCGLQTFYRAGLRASRVAVLNYYIIDGEYCADVSLLRSRAWRVDTSISCVAQVQMAAAIGPSGTHGEDAVREFASRSAPAIRDLLKAAVDRIEHGQAAGES